MPITTKQVPRPTALVPLAAPSCCQAAPNNLLPAPLEQGVVRRDGQHRALGQQAARDQVGQARAQQVRAPPGEEHMGAVVRPDACQLRAAEHPGHRAPPGLRDQPRDERGEGGEGGSSEVAPQATPTRRAAKQVRSDPTASVGPSPEETEAPPMPLRFLQPARPDDVTSPGRTSSVRPAGGDSRRSCVVRHGFVRGRSRLRWHGLRGGSGHRRSRRSAAPRRC